MKDNNKSSSSKKKSLRRSISWDVRPPKVINHHRRRHHHHHDRTQLKQRGSGRHLPSDPSFKSQNDDVSMDCENGDGHDDGGDDNDNSGVDQDEGSTRRQNEAWYTVSFLSWLFVWLADVGLVRTCVWV